MKKISILILFIFLIILIIIFKITWNEKKLTSSECSENNWIIINQLDIPNWLKIENWHYLDTKKYYKDKWLYIWNVTWLDCSCMCIKK